MIYSYSNRYCKYLIDFKYFIIESGKNKFLILSLKVYLNFPRFIIMSAAM